MALNIVPFSPPGRKPLPRERRELYFGDHPEFACQVGGHCLEPLLYQGDVVHFIRRDPKPGEIVACEMDGKPFIKVYQGVTDQGEIRLHMTNPEPGYYDLLLPPSSGLVVAGCAWQLLEASQTDRDLDGLMSLGVTVEWELYRRVTGVPSVN